MLTAKLFAGLASILTLIVFLAKLRALPPVPIYLQLVAALACVIFAVIYFTAARWMRTPLNQKLRLVQVGFIGISVGAFGFAVYFYPSLSSELVLQAISSSRLPLASSSVVLFSQQMQHGL